MSRGRRDVDEEDGAAAAMARGLLHLGLGDDDVRSAGGRYHDVAMQQALVQIGEQAQLAAESRRQLFRRGQGAVEEHEFGRARLVQVLGRQFPHFARAHHAHGLALEIAQHLLGQFHGRVADAHRALVDGGLAADALAHVDAGLEQVVEVEVDAVVLDGHAVGFLDLSEDLHFAQYHAVQGTDDAEEVADRLALGVEVAVVADLVLAHALAGAPQPFQHGAVARRAVRPRLCRRSRIGCRWKAPPLRACRAPGAGRG